MQVLDASQSRGWLIIAPATGVPSGYYRAFAEAAIEQGFTAVLFDYDIAGAPDRGKVGWIFQRIPEVIDATVERAGGLPVFLLGHSVGGHALGLGRSWDRLAGVIRAAPTTGYIFRTRRPVVDALRLLVMLPLLAALFGKAPRRLTGMGTDLSRKAAWQWALWCSRPGYAHRTHVATGTKLRVDIPVLDVFSDDDPYLNDWTRADLNRFYSFRDRQELCLTGGVGRRYGHSGLFRRQNSADWQGIWDWLVAQLPSA